MKNIITVKSSQQRGGQFIENHSYVILETKQLTTGERLVLLRNPWGEDFYNASWSDESNEWNGKQNQRSVPFDSRDGLFYSSIEDVFSSLESTFISYDTTAWHQDYFLMLDDPAIKNGKDRNCGS